MSSTAGRRWAFAGAVGGVVVLLRRPDSRVNESSLLGPLLLNAQSEIGSWVAQLMELAQLGLGLLEGRLLGRALGSGFVEKGWKTRDASVLIFIGVDLLQQGI